jgi:transcriptional regulator with XRE-family HTH domain
MYNESGVHQSTEMIEIGLLISHYNKIENGQREASVELLDCLAKLYGVSIDAIVYGR